MIFLTIIGGIVVANLVVGSGVGSAGKTVEVSSEVQVGSLTLFWSYDVPAVSSLKLTNGPVTGGRIVTVVGSGFGVAVYSVGVRCKDEEGARRRRMMSDESVG